jgi:hypothetical protein
MTSLCSTIAHPASKAGRQRPAEEGRMDIGWDAPVDVVLVASRYTKHGNVSFACNV